MINRNRRIMLASMSLVVSLLSVLLAYWVLTSTVLAQHSDNAVCPLSDQQTQKSVESFNKIAQVFTQQPRCVNCHGAVNPFGADAEDKHGGGKIDPIMKTEVNNNTGESETVLDEEATFAQCKDCHDAFKQHWMLPPAALFFAGKEPITLCHLEKDVFNFEADQFLGHIEHDRDPNNPFIQEAFTGRMGLNDRGQGLAAKYPAPPVGVTHQDLIQMAHDWIDAQRGKFRGNLECGCKPLHYAIVITQSEEFDIDQGIVQTHLVRSGSAQIPITFDDKGSFAGNATVTVAITETTTNPGGGCKATGKDSIPVTVSGSVDDDQETMHLKTNWNTTSTKLSGVCTVGNVSVPFNNTTPGESSSDVKTQLANGIDLPALEDESRDFPFPVPGGKDTISLTIKKIQ